MRILIIDEKGYMLDWSMRCKQAGHDVKHFIRDHPHSKDIGLGLVEVIRDFHEWLRWADLIVSSDNIKYIRELDAYKRENPGCCCLSCNIEGQELELNRIAGMKVMRDAGIVVPMYKEFTDYDKAIAYVKREDRRFVSKPNGDADKSLSYVSKTPADMVYMLERWKKSSKLKDSFILQDFIDGTEMAVGGWFSHGEWNEGWCENFEFKKFMNDDLGSTCYSDDTEVLTDIGWKFWPEVTKEDRLATLVDGRIEFEYPTTLVEKEIDEELIGWQSHVIDILVTQTHNMYVQDDHGRKNFYFEPANKTEKYRRLVSRGCGDWVGEDYGISYEKARLLGAYIADGNCKSRSIVFGNCPPHKQVQFIAFAKEAGYEAKLYGKDLYINSIELVKEYLIYGRAHEKFIPNYIKDNKPDIIKGFLEGYLAGDGTNKKGYNVIATTVSKRLADDLQELSLKLGITSSIYIRSRIPTHEINGIIAQAYRTEYGISFSQKHFKASLSPDNCYRLPYKGKVYCATVSTHILLVRRNGKPVWLGNTGEQGTVVQHVKQSKLAREMLVPLTRYLSKINYVGYVDCNCIIDEDQAWPLELTMRFGWPTFQIQCELMGDVDPAEWMVELCQGTDSQVFKTDLVGCGVVVSIPDYPYSHVTKKEVVGVPIYGARLEPQSRVHLCEVMQGEAPTRTRTGLASAPAIVSAGDYLLVMVGTGTRVSVAQRQAYQSLRRLVIPSSPMWRTDIGDRLKTELPRLRKMGYASRLEF